MQSTQGNMEKTGAYDIDNLSKFVNAGPHYQRLEYRAHAYAEDSATMGSKITYHNQDPTIQG